MFAALRRSRQKSGKNIRTLFECSVRDRRTKTFLRSIGKA